MASYQTEQKKLLVSFLKDHSESAFTIEDIAAMMKNSGVPGHAPGKSTIYRLMPKLIEEGVVKRFTRSGSRTFLYQIVDGEHCDKHLHLKCTECGKLFHLSDSASAAVLSDVITSSGFFVSRQKTVLFGRCAACGLEVQL